MKKSIGLDVKPPQAACQDRKCPWHGALPVRGKTFDVTVRSAKAANTAVVEWHYNRFVPKYERYERRKSRLTAHNPPCIKAKEGDRVIVAECRPISKTKSFVVVGVVR
ncbi:MAG: 30S ribosomal protein S17 [Candidatus Aenigmarchaeota archaeon]|nr:30S ribosomal protein S17 [Candidatus Aenigmarchaeota archaeon]